MHILIPLSGIGKRFLDAGFTTPKPLIEIDGKPMIEHVCNLFPNEDKFTFICNSKHLKETNMLEILKQIKPNANIISIEPHKKGPVYATLFAEHLIDDNEEVIVNYCDFGMYWDYEDFLAHTRAREADGAVVAYRGFHPHMLGTTNYAFMREKDQWMLEIKEKEPFTDNRMNEYASSGTYYFRKGIYVKKYFKELIDKNINVKGEYYVSLVYNLLVQDNLKVSIYEIQHMLQWGTPEDVEEYNRFSRLFNKLIAQMPRLESKNSITLIPLAGAGARFAKAGYKTPKPLIEVSGKPMIIQAANSLPKSQKEIFVILKEHDKTYNLSALLKSYYPNAKVVAIDSVTQGQAITCSLGLENENKESSLLIGATDNGMIYDENKFQELISDNSIDAIIFTFRHHISSKLNPHMYGWVEIDKNNNVKRVSVKVPISDNPYNDHAIVGTFWFKRLELFDIALKTLLQKDIKVNGEYYVDSLFNELIELGYRVKIFEIDEYICWGTPNDYESFVYWQSFFHKCPWHPYSLQKDFMMDSSKINELDKRYREFSQKWR